MDCSQLSIQWDTPQLAPLLCDASLDVDALTFGVIGVDRQLIVQTYNRYEALQTGLTKEKVVGKHVFTQVAQCMNNFMVAQKFDEAIAHGSTLDETLNYVLTWRMRPTPVRLRLLWLPDTQTGWIVLHRLA